MRVEFLHNLIEASISPVPGKLMRIGDTERLWRWQGFKWAVEQDQWQARAASIPQVFAAAARDMGKPAVDSQVVAAVWQRLLPGERLFDVSHRV